MCLAPFCAVGPGSGVRLTEASLRACARARLLPSRSGAARAQAEAAASSYSLRWWGPATAGPAPTQASIMELDPVLRWGDQSRWQERDERMPVAVVPTVWRESVSTPLSAGTGPACPSLRLPERMGREQQWAASLGCGGRGARWGRGLSAASSPFPPPCPGAWFNSFPPLFASAKLSH